jgi:hypothetical protein
MVYRPSSVVLLRFSVKNLLFVLFALLLTACAQPGQPVMEVAELHDFGTITKGETAVVELPLRNTGESPLIIEALVTTCGCTSAEIDSMTIQPGETATLRLSYDSAAHEIDMGPLERRIFIISNDSADGDKMIRLLVLVEPAPEG